MKLKSIKAAIVVSVLAFSLLLLAACSGDTTTRSEVPDSRAVQSSQAEIKTPIASSSIPSPEQEESSSSAAAWNPTEENTYQYIFDKGKMNAALEQWVGAYRRGEYAQIYFEDPRDGYLQSWRLTCDGSDEYLIERRHLEENAVSEVCGSSRIITEGAAYYSFGEDLSSFNPMDYLPVTVEKGVNEWKTLEADDKLWLQQVSITEEEAVALADEAVQDGSYGNEYILQVDERFARAGICYYALTMYIDGNYETSLAVSADGTTVWNVHHNFILLEDKASKQVVPNPAELNKIFANNSPEGSVEFLLYLFENYEEVATLPDAALPYRENDHRVERFRHILYVYQRDGLHETDVEVLDCQPVDTETLLGVSNITNRYRDDLSFYKIDVDIKDGGETKGLPEGRTTWLCGLIEDNHQFIDFLLPYDEAVRRLKIDIEFPDEAAKAGQDASMLRCTFSSPDEIPVDRMIWYLLWQDTEKGFIDEGDYYGTTMTQQQLDAAAKRYFNIDHVDGMATSFYEEEIELYYAWLDGPGGPDFTDVLKVEKSANTTIVYFDANGVETDYRLMNAGNYMRKIHKHTYINEYLVSIEEVDSSDFTSVILTGENA